MTRRALENARRDVMAFLRLYGGALHASDGHRLAAKAQAASIHTRLSAASIAQPAASRHQDQALAKLSTLIGEATHNPVAFQACRELRRMLLNDGLPTPESLDAFLATATEPPRPRGRDRLKHLSRDAILTECVMIARDHGLPAYQDDLHHTTAVGVASECLEAHGTVLSREGVKKAWQRYASERQRRA